MIGVSERVMDIVNSVLETKLSNENVQDNLAQIGMDSIKFIQIVVALEESFEIEVPDEKLLITTMGTLEQMIEVVSIVLQNAEK